MDRYITETMERYKKDRIKSNDLEKEIALQQEQLHKLQSRMSAYNRILREELGFDAVKKLEEEIDSVSSKTNEVTLSPQKIDGAPNSNFTITQVILDVIKKVGNEGVTAAQVVSNLQQYGFGPEKRNTVYGTLSRLKTDKRIRKTGERYFTV